MPPARPPRNALRGILLLARWKRGALAEFGESPADFLNSLAPILACTLVATLLRLADGDAREAVDGFMMSLVTVLTPPVVIQALGRRWKPDASWLRTATAFTWSHWIILASLAFALVTFGSLLTAAGASLKVAVIVAELAWVAYGLVLYGFLIRLGLGIKIWQCVVMLASIQLGTGALLAGPLLLADYIARAVP